MKKNRIIWITIFFLIANLVIVNAETPTTGFNVMSYSLSSKNMKNDIKMQLPTNAIIKNVKVNNGQVLGYTFNSGELLVSVDNGTLLNNIIPDIDVKEVSIMKENSDSTVLENPIENYLTEDGYKGTLSPTGDIIINKVESSKNIDNYSPEIYTESYIKNGTTMNLYDPIPIALNKKGWTLSDTKEYSDTEGYSGILNADYKVNDIYTQRIEEFNAQPIGTVYAQKDVVRSFKGIVKKTTDMYSREYKGNLSKDILVDGYKYDVSVEYDYPIVLQKTITKTVSSYNSSVSDSLDLPANAEVTNITVNNGNVTNWTHDKNNAKLNFSVNNGNLQSGLIYNSTKYSQYYSTYKESSSSYMASGINVSTGDGYSGYITADGSTRYVRTDSGSQYISNYNYISTYVDVYKFVYPQYTDNLVAYAGYGSGRTMYYNDGTYSGTLTSSAGQTFVAFVSQEQHATDPVGAYHGTALVWMAYNGTVYKSVPIYRTDYSGYIYKGGYDSGYQYTITVKYNLNVSANLRGQYVVGSGNQLNWDINDTVSDYYYDIYRDGVLIKSNNTTNSYIDSTGVDKKVPLSIDSNSIQTNKTSENSSYYYMRISFTPPQDEGTDYNYYVIAKHKATGQTIKSNTITINSKSGIKGYRYSLSTSQTFTPSSTVNLTNTYYDTNALSFDVKYYFNIIAIDNNNNYSPVTTIPIQNSNCRIDGLKLVKNHNIRLTQDVIYPVSQPVGINNGYLLTFDVSTYNINQINIELYSNNINIPIYTETGSKVYTLTQNSSTTQTIKTVKFYVKSLPKGSILDIKLRGVYTSGSYNKEIVNVALGNQALKVVGDSTLDTLINLTN